MQPGTKSFKDVNGKLWSIVVDLNTLERVKDQTGFPLMKLVDIGRDNAVDTLSDPVDLLRVLVSIIQPEKYEHNIEQFKAAISDGDVLDDAAKALLNAVIDFLPRRQKSLMQSAVSMTHEAKPQMIDAATKMLAAQAPAIRAALKTIGEFDYAGNLAASPKSTPEPTDSAT